MGQARILVVDDEETLCEALRFNLEAENYEVEVAYSAEEALRLPLPTFDLILLDVMMGEISGFALAKKLRQQPETAGIPIIFCTAKDTEDNMMTGFRIGGDDYIVKPYTIRNVLARVKAVLRRTAPQTGHKEPPTTLTCMGITVDTRAKRLCIDGQEVPVTKKELEILQLLMENKGRIFSREEILSQVWGDKVVVLDRTIDVNITRLRQKLGAYGKCIITRSGYGYGFEE